MPDFKGIFSSKWIFKTTQLKRDCFRNEVKLLFDKLNPNPLGILARNLPESSKILH